MRSRRAVSVVPISMLLVFSILNTASAQTLQTEHVYKLDDADSRPAGSLDDVAWMVGSWTGDAFGNRFEEVWNPASAGSMVGMWKLLDGDQVIFYEFLLLVEEEGSLSIKVKHFNDDMTAWEDKEDYVRFRLVKLDESAVHFSGLSFHRISADEIHGYIALHSDGTVREEKMVYRRRAD